MNCLNLGCGNHYHSTWTNVNFVSTDESIIAHNLTQSIPFPDNSFDVVYHSHLLEHFPKDLAKFFIKECYRVLRNQGILRVVVPDLENIVRAYLYTLEEASFGSKQEDANYEWILLEMYDQTVRNKPGGEMTNYLFQEDISNEDFILQRLGTEAKNLIEKIHQFPSQQTTSTKLSNSFLPKGILKGIYRFLRYSNYRRETLIKLLLKEEYNTLQIGRFRQSGEVHQWMYDRYSLKKILAECNFKEITQRTASKSYIPEWTSFNLDTEPDGTVYKPDSLFMEAIKPA